jgi:hypothetical protein
VFGVIVEQLLAPRNRFGRGPQSLPTGKSSGVNPAIVAPLVKPIVALIEFVIQFGESHDASPSDAESWQTNGISGVFVSSNEAMMFASISFAACVENLVITGPRKPSN